MNKQRHRLVFNARRGQIMAVAESASCVGGDGKTSSVGLVLSVVLLFSASVQAQIIADPQAPSNQRPTIHSAPNGVPLVNIQTPTAGGVSRNTYQQFDVQRDGVILNNSRTNVQTQLGGWVQGNPWLAAGPARIIVNEVNSSNPSLLNGYVEVAGQRAQVIIANPSGIQVQGGGFINASKATLTTGKPVFEKGSLEGFRVKGGNIRIGGTGLDTSSTDYTAILARAVEVNAGIWAQELQVVTGVNDVSADMVTSRANEPAGVAPTYALDVAQLGGMYAAKIHLVGTEAGVGVNLRGVVGATAGDVVIDASGKLFQRGTLQASGNVRMQSGDEIHNTGDVYSGADLVMSTAHALTNGGGIEAIGVIQLEGASLQNLAGSRIAATSDLKIQVDGLLGNHGQVASAGQLRLRADELDNADGQMQGKRLDVEARTLNNLQGSIWQTGSQALMLTLGDLDNTGGRIGSAQAQDTGAPTGDATGGAGGGNPVAGGATTGSGGSAPGRSSGPGPTVIQPEPGFVRVVEQTVNQEGVVAAEGSISASARSLVNQHGSVYVDSIDIRGAALDNANGRIDAREIETVVDSLSNTDGAIEAQSLDLNAAQLENVRGLIGASHKVHIVANERLDNAQGDIQSLHGHVEIEAGQLMNAGRVRSAGDMNLQVHGEMINSGVIAAEGDATIAAGSLFSSGALAAGLKGDGQLASDGNLQITTTGNLQAGGLNLAAGTLSFTGGALDLANSQTGAKNQQLLATDGDVDTRGATVAAAEVLSLSANNGPSQSLDNQGGTISAGELQLQVARLDNVQGRIVHTGTGEMQITAQGLLNNQGGAILGNGSVSLQAGELDNSADGRVWAGDTLHIESLGRLDNAGGAIEALGDLHLQARDIANARGRVVGGAGVTVQAAAVGNTAGGLIQASGDLSLGIADLNNNGGLLQAVGNVTAQGDGANTTLTNREGLIRAGGNIELLAEHIDNSQTLASQQGIEGLNVTLEAGAVVNQSGSVVADQNLTLNSGGVLDNSLGRLSAGHTLSLLDGQAIASASATLEIANTGGTLVANERVRVHAARLGLDGQIYSQRDIDLHLSGDHTLAQGTSLVANRNLAVTLDNGDLTNNGQLQAGQMLEVDARNVTNNSAGVIGAETVQLRPVESLVNRGLIDGVDTEVSARNVTNTASGRIYGQDVQIRASGSLINEGDAVIAAHETLQLGVGDTLTNRDGAILLSLGKLAVGGGLDADGLAVGAAQAIVNRSATIESMGDMRLGAARLSNLNDQLIYQVEAAGTSSRTDYYTPIGYVGSEDVAWTAPTKVTLFSTGNTWTLYSHHRRLILPKSSSYSDPAYEAYYSGPEPFVPEHFWYTRAAEGDLRAHPVADAFSYDRYSPVWQLFGMAAPAWDAPGGRPQPRERVNDTLPPDPEAMAAWLAAAAPWQELQNRISAFRAVVEADLISFDMYRSYTESTQAARVTSSRPAEIRSGGSLALQVDGATLNQDSSIVAGGSITVQGGSVVNQSTTVSAPTQRTGTMNNWAVIGKDCDFGHGCDPVYGWVSSPYAETIQRNVALGSVRYEQGVLPASPSVQPGAFSAPSTQAQAHATGSVSQAVPSVTPVQGTPLPGGSSPPPLHVGVPDPVRLGAPTLTLPTSALFQLHPGSSSNYFVETDPRFTDQRQWLSSDYMLAALSVDPAAVQKRLGDGFYEQRLVREQVAALTGYRFLGDYTSDEQQYRELMNSGATFAQAHQLRPGIALSAAQVASLTSDIVWLVERTVSLPDGTTAQALVPQLYVRPKTGDLQPTGALLAGRDVNLDMSDDLTNASGTIAGRQVTQISARNVHNLGGLIASGGFTAIETMEDIRNIGGAISAKDVLTLEAGRDLSVQTTTIQGVGNTGVGTYTSQGIDRVAALYVSSPIGLLLAGAGRDVNLTAAVVQSEGGVQLQAGRDITLDTVQTRTDIAVKRDDRNYAGVRQREEIGTRIISEGGTSLIAGQDIHTRAAQVQAQGQLGLQADRDVNIEAGEQSLATDNASYAKGSGFLSSGSTEVRERRSETNAVGSSMGGQRVDIETGRDTSVKGSSVIGDEGTTVTAGRDVNITAAQTSRSESRFEENKSSGLFLSDGGITLGSQQHSTDLATQGTGAAGSTVGAISGNVNITAAQTYQQTGSDVLAPGGDINVQAQRIQITEARVTDQLQFEEKARQGGLTLGISGGAVAAVQGMAQMGEAVGETGDARMKALGVAAAGLQAKGAVDGIQAASAQGASPADAATAGMSLSISIGASSSQSNSQSQSNHAQGSTLEAGGDVNLKAIGAGAQSDIVVRGSEVSAGDTVRLQAQGGIELLAAQNHITQSSSSKNSSGSIGLSLGAQTGITIAASAGKGQGAGEETTHTNTRIESGRLVQIESGGDTTLQGAVVQADTVKANVGGDLRIESLQDTSTYRESSQQVGGSVTIGMSAGGGSLSISKSKIDSNYESVNEQSAIRAGDGGFQVKVDGATELIGGAVTSTQAAVDKERNEFKSEGGLNTSDIQNRAEYNASGFSISGGTGGGSPSGGAGIGQDSGSASSVTEAGISGVAGNTDARTGDAETGLNPIFDKERVKDEVNAQVAITKAFGQQAVPMAASYADRQAIALRREGNEQEARKWDEGGEYRVAVHAAIGALTGGIAGAVGATAGATLIPALGEEIAGMNLSEPVRQGVTAVVGAAVGAATGGVAGAATSLNQTIYNYVSHSPFASVRRTVSQENARLVNECGANCTAGDYQRIDQQMAALERAGNLSEIAQRGVLTTQQAQQFAQLVMELAPVYGTGESLLQLVTGRSTLTGEDASRIWAAVGVVPLAGGVLKQVGEPSIEAIQAILRNAGPVFRTTKEAAQVAQEMGYTRINETIKGQAVFKKGDSYITRDIDGHNGGAWKEATSLKDLASKESRRGTFNSDLSQRIGP